MWYYVWYRKYHSLYWNEYSDIRCIYCYYGWFTSNEINEFKQEKNELSAKLSVVNEELKYNQNRIEEREEVVYRNNRRDFINQIYDDVLSDNFEIKKYDSCNLALNQRLKIYDDVLEAYKKAETIFSKLKYTTDDIDEILSGYNIFEYDEMYGVYYSAGIEHAQKYTDRFPVIPDTGALKLYSKFDVLEDRIEKMNLRNDLQRISDIYKWKNIEKQDLENKINAINDTLRTDLKIFFIATLFGIIVPQLVLCTYPLFKSLKFLKYVFSVYSILSFVMCMFLTFKYIYNLYKSIQND